MDRIAIPQSPGSRISVSAARQLQHVFEEPHYLRTGKASKAGIIDRIGDEEMTSAWDHHGADEETRLFESGKKRRGLCRRINNVVMVCLLYTSDAADE